MRILFLSVVIAAVAGIAPQKREHDPADLVGRWSGAGVFFDQEFRERTGSVPIALIIDRSLEGTGQIGGATMRITQVRARSDHLEIVGRLAGNIGSRELSSKDHVVFVVTAVSDSSARAEFHLKSNAMFDPRMREGAVTLVRQ